MKIRIGTRGSDLALAQTNWVIEQLRRVEPDVQVETVIISTHGDRHAGPIGGEHWPIGGFVGAIEQELLAGRIDAAVHSFKDLPTGETPGLIIAAVPSRETPNDVLVSAAPLSLDDPQAALRIGTSSARRSAQVRWMWPRAEVVPIRGNVPTRIARIGELGLDGVVLAAAGLNRLGLIPEHLIVLPDDRFVPAPGQGALAVQVRSESKRTQGRFASSNSSGLELNPGLFVECLRRLDHEATRRAVQAERAFLSALGAGCQTPAGALAIAEGDDLMLRGQLFSPDGGAMADGVQQGDDPTALGELLATKLRAELQGML